MPFLRCLALAAAVLLLPALGPARATPLVPTLSERSVFAEAAAENGPRTSSQSNGDGAVAFEPLDTSVSAGAPADAAEGAAQSSQTSSLGADRFDGAGAAQASAASTAPGGLATAAADSFFLVVFESSAAAPVVLEGLLSATGAGDVFARFELEEELSGVPIFFFEALPGQSVSLAGMADLEAGTSYRLLAIASAVQDIIGLGGPAAGSASFGFSLRVVPEPSSLLLVGLAVALLARARQPRA